MYSLYNFKLVQDNQHYFSIYIFSIYMLYSSVFIF